MSRQDLRRVPRRTVLAAGLSVVSGAALASTREPSERARVIVVLSGGADGLSLVVPYQDPLYFRARPKTAVAPPGRGAEGAVALDDQFALHPRLAPIHPMFEAGELAIGVAVGARELDRGHASASQTLRRAVLARGPILSGPPSASWAPQADSGVGDPTTLADRLQDLGRTIRRGGRPETHVVRSGGWDTHVAQGDGSSGRLAAAIDQLGRGLAAWRRELGPDLDRATLFVVSEFGRALRETPMGGTDDGHAGICLLLGGGVRGGRVIGRWPGLRADALSQGRHVAVTTNLRQMLAEGAALGEMESA